MLFAATSGAAEIDPRLAIVLGLLAAGSVHTAKSVSRPAITATSGGCANPVVSFLEDVIAVVMVLLALLAPILLVGVALVAEANEPPAHATRCATQAQSPAAQTSALQPGFPQ